MQTTFVLGSARSGAGALTGLLASSGWSVGPDPLPASLSHPHGSWLSRTVVDIDEVLLGPWPWNRYGRRWLSDLGPHEEVPLPAKVEEWLRALTAREGLVVHDPRLIWTLPAWQRVFSEHRAVFVFRNPWLVVDGLEEHEGLDRDRALAHWEAAARRALALADDRWHFLHVDQLYSRQGISALSQHLGHRVDASALYPRRRPPEPTHALPSRVAELYTGLCERAGFEPRLREEPALPRVALVSHVRDEASGRAVVRSARLQRGVSVECLLVSERPLDIPGATWVRAPAPGQGAALGAVLEASDAELFALQDPRVSSLPMRLLTQVERLGGADLLTCDGWLTDVDGGFTTRQDCAPAAKPALWESGLLLRRSALERVRTVAFWPVLLELHRALEREGKTTHLSEPLWAAPADLAADLAEEATMDLHLVDDAPHQGELELSVLMASYDRREVLLECLRSFCRQTAPVGSWEIVVAVDGSPDDTVEVLETLELPVPFTWRACSNRGAAAARNVALHHVHSPHVLFVNDDTIAFPDLIQVHREARAEAPPNAMILGTFEWPPELTRESLTELFQTTSLIFAYPQMKAGKRYGGQFVYTCNISVPTEPLLAIGGFDEDFSRCYAEDTELGVRLGKAGLHVLYEPRARSWHQHRFSVDDFVKRQRWVARSHIRLFAKHPDYLRTWRHDNATVDLIERMVVEQEDKLAEVIPIMRQLGDLRLGPLAAQGPDFEDLAQASRDRLHTLLKYAHTVAWNQGIVEGLADFHLHGYAELVARGRTEPWPLNTHLTRRWLAWSDWSQAELSQVFATWAEALRREELCLVLRRDPQRDPPADEALAALVTAHALTLGEDTDVSVLLVEDAIEEAWWPRLGVAVERVLELPSGRHGARRRFMLATVGGHHEPS